MNGINQPLERIEKALPRDLEGIKDLLTISDLTLAGIEETEFWIVRGEEAAMPKACMGLETHSQDGLLRSVAVKKQYQKSGIGSGLVLHMMRVAKERKLQNLYLLTTTARDFFLRFGFFPINRVGVEKEAISKSREFEACSETSTLMKLQISQ